MNEGMINLVIIGAGFIGFMRMSVMHKGRHHREHVRGNYERRGAGLVDSVVNLYRTLRPERHAEKRIEHDTGRARVAIQKLLTHQTRLQDRWHSIMKLSQQPAEVQHGRQEIVAFCHDGEQLLRRVIVVIDDAKIHSKKIRKRIKKQKHTLNHDVVELDDAVKDAKEVGVLSHDEKHQLHKGLLIDTKILAELREIANDQESIESKLDSSIKRAKETIHLYEKIAALALAQAAHKEEKEIQGIDTELTKAKHAIEDIKTKLEIVALEEADFDEHLKREVKDVKRELKVEGKAEDAGADDEAIAA